MKFTSVVVMLALAFCASASVLPISSLGLSPLGLGASPWALSPYGLSPYGLSPYGLSPWASQLAIQPQAISLSQGIAAPTVLAAPQLLRSGITLQAARLAPIAAPIAIAAAEGNYVAANRGSVHVAPLPGHALSATSLNLEPAPGTL